MENFKKTVAQNITKLRTAKGLTQAELGELLSYSDKSISKWERADAVPDAFVLKKMAAIFNVTVDYLLDEHSPDEKIVVEKPRAYSRTVISVITPVTAKDLVAKINVITNIINNINFTLFNNFIFTPIICFYLSPLKLCLP